MTRIIFFTFAGREENMEIQRPHIERLLAANPGSELHLWDLTRRESDSHYIRRWAADHSQVAYVGHLHPGHPFHCLGEWRGPGHRRCTCVKHKPPYEEPYRYYAENPHRGSKVPDYNDDTVFVKFDDDVLWMDSAKQFAEVIAFLETEPGQVASANVYNNAVCAKYEPKVRDLIWNHAIGHEGHNPDPLSPTNDQFWWSQHIAPNLAVTSHAILAGHIESAVWPEDREPFPTREGEAVSINFVAMKYPVLREAARRMFSTAGRMGDEGAIDSMLPWIIPNFRVGHLTFGPQEKALGLKVDVLRQMYATSEGA